MAVHLAADDEVLGSLNFYSTVRDTIDPEAFHRASLFATHAALALGYARRVEAMHASAQTHRLIGQAIGMLVERFEIDDDRSFYYLVRVASAGGLELRQVADRKSTRLNSSHANISYAVFCLKKKKKKSKPLFHN